MQVQQCAEASSFGHKEWRLAYTSVIWGLGYSFVADVGRELEAVLRARESGKRRGKLLISGEVVIWQVDCLTSAQAGKCTNFVIFSHECEE